MASARHRGKSQERAKQYWTENGRGEIKIEIQRPQARAQRSHGRSALRRSDRLSRAARLDSRGLHTGGREAMDAGRSVRLGLVADHPSPQSRRRGALGAAMACHPEAAFKKYHRCDSSIDRAFYRVYDRLQKIKDKGNREWQRQAPVESAAATRSPAGLSGNGIRFVS